MKLNLFALLVGWLFPGLIFYTQAQPKSDPVEDSIALYKKTKRWDRLIVLMEQKAENLKKEKGEFNAGYGNILRDLGHAQFYVQQLQEAETSYTKSLEILTKVYGGEYHLDVGKTYESLGLFYRNMKDLPKSEANFLKRVAIEKKVGNDTSASYLYTLLQMGSFYYMLGDYKKAEEYYALVLSTREKTLRPDHPEIAEAHRYLGIVYKAMGEFPKVETHFQKALEINRKAYGEMHPAVALAYNNVGAAYGLLRNQEKAAAYLEKSLEIRKKLGGEETDDIGQSYLNLANIYEQLGNHQKALGCGLKALAILKKTRGENDVFIGFLYTNLVNAYEGLGCFRKAEESSLKSIEIQKKAGGDNHPDLANMYASLGSIQTSMGEYKKAEENNLKALNIMKARLGPDYTHLGTVNEYLATLYLNKGNFPKAEHHFKEMIRIRMKECQHNFPSLTDEEKDLFFEAIRNELELFKSFSSQRYASDPAITGDLYDLQLATKGLLMNSAAKWKHRIKSGGDVKLFTLYTQWLETQKELINARQSEDSLDRITADSLQAKSDKMEKELSLRSESFGKLADRKLTTWQEVKKVLKPGEVAIELIRLYKYGLRKTETDTSDPRKTIYPLKGITDTIYYMALIVKPGSVYPEMVLLKNGNDLEGRHLKFYQNSMKNSLPDSRSYPEFWEKIGARVGSAKRIYFSPDGVFHNINLNTLRNPKTKKYLLEEKEIQIVTSTKDKVNPGQAEELNNLAELVGFPDYYQNNSTTSVATAERKSPELRYGFRFESIGTLSALPATKTEVDNIAGLLTDKGWEVKNLTGSQALEENVKESYKPRLLHIATHGFFQPDTTKGSNPLLRSGLMLTGAGATLRGQKSETNEDGILTAYEAMNLNLDNTDLVVLSACETGLGEIKNGEGVYGLQRAFKVAGAKSIIMSLWKVDDEATQELMVSFYRHWLGSTVGGERRTADAKAVWPKAPTATASKRSAFLAAQKELKAKYPNPYYWGAFVMVGE